MPIKIADSLPARAVLESENIFVMTEHRAATQDIRPLRIGLLNLMPLKIITETQILRCLSNTPIQIEVDLIQTETYHPKIHQRIIFSPFTRHSTISATRSMTVLSSPVRRWRLCRSRKSNTGRN